VSLEVRIIQSIESLRREHRVVILVAESARSRLLEKRTMHLAEIDRFVDFLRYHTLACHEPKEDLLFAALQRRGLSQIGGTADMASGIVVGYDGSDGAKAALDEAIDLAKQLVTYAYGGPKTYAGRR
jgi:hypothetical protein